eukprot:947520-Amphidinium_carterae.1
MSHVQPELTEAIAWVSEHWHALFVFPGRELQCAFTRCFHICLWSRYFLARTKRHAGARFDH